MAAPYPKITYVSGGTQTLTFKRGPVNFACNAEPVIHRNLSTSGAAQETVMENMALIITFSMPHLVANDDLAAWEAFLVFALAGGQFRFYPNVNLPDYYNCWNDADTTDAKRNAPSKYGASFRFRIANDVQAPAGPWTVLRRLMGITT